VGTLERIENFVDSVESTAVDLVARLSPWLAPLPTAYLTATATIKHLSWPSLVGAVAGVVVEALGLASVSTALMLREYNATRNKIPDDWQSVDARGRRKKYRGKIDPEAPFKLTVLLAGVYFISVTALTVALDTLPELATFAPLIFPILSLAGVTILAIRADHRWRLRKIKERDTQESSPKAVQKGRSRSAQIGVQETSAIVQQSAQRVTQIAALDEINRSRQERKTVLLGQLLGIYLSNPETGVTDVSRQLGVARNTVYNYLNELEEAGRIDRGNGSVIVLEG